jgi:hypothetical protein
VVGRELTFADAKIIELVNEHFIPVAMDDWFQRRRQDAEGEFFRKVADQGPRQGQGGSTRQGIYTFTANGKLLQYRNNQDPDVMRGFLATAMKAWNKLPAAERAKDAVQVAELKKVDGRFVPTLPKDALIVNVHARILDRTDDFYCLGSCQFPGGQRASHDHLWIRANEWQSLIPKDAQKGQEIAVPAKLMYRLARYHLVDNTRGEPPMWARGDVRKAEMKLVVEEATKSEVRLKLAGAFVLATDADAKAAKRGYDVSLYGEIRYEPGERKITKFNVVALGDYWGEGAFTGGARPGRNPFGVAFELADPTRPANRVPPQAIREGRGYYDAER